MLETPDDIGSASRWSDASKSAQPPPPNAASVIRPYGEALS